MIELKRPREKPRGIALVTVLMVTFFLTMLTGALIETHAANFAMLGESVSQRQSYLAACSGLDFARYLLELNCQVGRPGSSGNWGASLSWGTLQISQLNPTGTDQVQFVGNVTDSVPPSQFTVTITNNYQPPQSATSGLVTIDTIGTCGTFQTHTQTTMKAAPLYDSALCSNGNMDLSQVGNLSFGSTDPLRNWVRSNGNVTTNDTLDNPSTISFTSSSPGMIWAKGAIDIGPSNDYTSNIAPNPTLAATLFNKVNGQMAPHSSLNYNIYQLKMSDLNITSAVGSSGNAFLASGTYTAMLTKMSYTQTTYTATGHWSWGSWYFDGWSVGQPQGTTNYIPTLQYTNPNTAVTTNFVYSPGTAQPGVPNQGALIPVESPPSVQPQPGLVVTNFTNVPPLPSGSQVISQRYIRIDAGSPTVEAAPTGNFEYDIVANAYTSNNKQTIETDGNLTLGFDVTNNTGGVGPPTAPNAMGASSLTFLNLTAPGTAGPAAAIVAPLPSSTLNLHTSIAGAGIPIVVGSNSTLTVAANTTLVAPSTNNGLVLYSAGNVFIDAAGGTQMYFNGLAYANNSVSLYNMTGSASLNQLTVDGALVAQSGTLSLYNAINVTANYDPAYLNLFTRGLPAGTGRFVQTAFQVL